VNDSFGMTILNAFDDFVNDFSFQIVLKINTKVVDLDLHLSLGFAVKILSGSSIHQMT
jgi:hypothetical protein